MEFSLLSTTLIVFTFIIDLVITSPTLSPSNVTILPLILRMAGQYQLRFNRFLLGFFRHFGNHNEQVGSCSD